MNHKEQEMKSKLRLDINRSLLAICFTLFGLIITLQPSLLRNSVAVSLQLTIAIPLLLSSSFGRSKLAYTQRPVMWENYGFYTFLIGYTCLINVMGILLSIYTSLNLGIIFFAGNVIISMIYSVLEVAETKSKLVSRIRKDAIFIALIILGGIIPSLG